MPRKQTNSWGDPIHFSQSLTAGQEYPGPSPHAEMSWTVCYDDDCEIHLCEKQGSGWFPKRKGRKGPRNGKGKGKGKGKGARRDLDEDDPENRPWGDGGDGGGCPIPTEEEVKVILARKAAREAAEAKAAAAAASGVKKGVRIGQEEEAKPKAGVGGGVKPKAAPEVKSDWAERIRELLAGGVKAGGGARLNTSKCDNDSSGRFPAGAIAKPVSSAGNPTPAVAKHEPCSGKGQFPSPNRNAIAPANLKPGFEKKLFTSPPITTAKTPQKIHLTSSHTTAMGTPTEHNSTSEKKRSTSPPVTTTHAPAIPNPHLEKKQRFASSPPTNPRQKKQPLQPRKDQGKINLYTKPPKTSHQNPPVAASVPTAAITARVAVKAKLAAEREEKLPQMVNNTRMMGAKAGVV